MGKKIHKCPYFGGKTKIQKSRFDKLLQMALGFCVPSFKMIGFANVSVGLEKKDDSLT